MAVIVFLFLFLVIAVHDASGQQLKVNVITNADPTINPFAGLAWRGCTELEAHNLVRCRNTIILPFANATNAIAAWDTVVGNSDDDVYVGAFFSAAGPVAALSPKYPTKSFVAIDATVAPNANKNTIGVVFAEDQSGFLAGVLAGVFTTSRRVGVIAGTPAPPVKRFVNGYHSGVAAVCPACETFAEFVPSFSNVTLGIQAVTPMLASGVDVVFGAGGAMGSGTILHAAGQGAWVIGVDSDESQTTFLSRSEVSQLLSSAMKRADTAVKTAIDYIKRGERGGFNLNLDVSLGGVGLADLVSTPQKNFSTPVTVSLRQPGSNLDSCAATTHSSRVTILNLVRSSLQRRTMSTGVFAVTGDLQPLTAPSNKTWYDLTPFGERLSVLPNIQGHSAVVIPRNRVLMWGGQNQFAEYSQQVMVLDFDRFMWTKAPDRSSARPRGRMFHAMGFDEEANRVYIFGGQLEVGSSSTANAFLESVMRDVWAYSIDTAQWNPVVFGPDDAQPSARTNMAYATVGRHLYVYGGITGTAVVQNDFWRFDFATMKWAQLTSASEGSVPLPALQHASFVAINSTTLGLYGGVLASSEYSNSLYVFDIPSNSWRLERPSTLLSGPPPGAERMAAVALDTRRVLFTGGISAQGMLNSTWVWRMDEQRWDNSAYGPLPGGLHSHALVTFNQSATVGACEYPVGASIWKRCNPPSANVVVAISGVTNRAGSGLLVSYANPDPPPPPVGQIDLGAKWPIAVINIVGIMTALFLTAFISRYRAHKVIRAANPPFCLIIVIGALISHVGLVASMCDSEQRRGVMQTALLLGGGYSLMFSALVTKIYIVHSIFSSRRIIKTKVHKRYGFIALVFGAQMLLSGLWFLFDATPTLSLNVAGTVWVVSSLNANWVVLCSMPVVALTLFGLYFAYKTRAVQVEYNEGLYLAIVTYMTALTLLIVGTVVLLLQQPLVQFIISATLTSLTTLAVQLTFFVPKLQIVFLDGPNSRVESAIVSNISNSSGNSDGASVHHMRCKSCKQTIAGGNSAAGQGVSSSAPLTIKTFTGVSIVPPSATCTNAPSPKRASLLLTPGSSLFQAANKAAKSTSFEDGPGKPT